MAAAAAGRAERQEAAGRALKRGRGLPGWGASSEQRSCWAIWPATRMYVCREGARGGNYGEGGVVSMGAMTTVCVCADPPQKTCSAPPPFMCVGGSRLCPLPPALHLPRRHRRRTMEPQPDQPDAVPQPLGFPPPRVQGARDGAAAAASRGQHQVQSKNTGPLINIHFKDGLVLPTAPPLPSHSVRASSKARARLPLRGRHRPLLSDPAVFIPTPPPPPPLRCRSQRWWSMPSPLRPWMQSP